MIPLRKIENIFSVLTGISLAVVFIVTFGQVIQRYVFQLPMPWATDVIRIFFVYSIFLGMGVGVFKKAHLNIDVLVQVFPSWAKPWFDLLSNVVVIIFLSFVLYFSIPFIKANADQVTPYLLFPMSYIYMIIPIAVSFMVLFLLLDTAKLLVSLFGRDRFTNSGSR
ncbi:TRAP transporter small permease [Aminobacterium sp. EBM-42]|uniref:TRAP transporter small permease n=1 Tax=Aminobacterium TaxID=81466 RepID=UPI00257CE507|nr:TRAP transporter small permease [Aminobacterium sp. EBM-42]MDD4585240.1 TRAP transporter small permease [Aminobacterium colombiense]